MQKGVWQVGRIWGIPLQFHWSFLLIAIWILWQGWQPGYGWRSSQLTSVTLGVGLVFLSVVLHEYGHALMARRFGVKTERILIFPLGGGAFLRSLPDDPRQEILIAFAGPMVNILLAALLGSVIWWPGLERLPLLLSQLLNPLGNTFLVASSLWEYAIVLFFVFNLILAIFNLLPAYPLDGGRILRVLLKVWLGARRARQWSAYTGIAFSIGFLWMAYRSGDWILGVGASFICFVGFFELERGRREARLYPYKVSDRYRPIDQALYATDTVAFAKSLNRQTEHRFILVLDEWQQVIGVVDESALMQVDGAAEEKTIAEVMTDEWLSILPTEPLEGVYQKMGLQDADVAVVSDGLKTYGLLTMDTLLDLMQGAAKK